jgi:SAM-dependent methyltransferase
MDSAASQDFSVCMQTPLDITADIRRVLLLLAVDTSGLRNCLKDVAFLSSSSVDPTFAKLLKAGAVLGIFENVDKDLYTWSSDYKWVPNHPSEWQQLIAIIHQQLTYLSMVSDHLFWTSPPPTPSEQLTANPSSYRAFLTGVAASHTNHAIWITDLDMLKQNRVMADIGGGLGTYGLQWIKSRGDRHAIVIDFPDVEPFLSTLLRQTNGRLDFVGADITTPFALPPYTDFALFANVLHLVENWEDVLLRSVNQLRPGSLIGVFEADPSSPSGALFDLQVHLRSGRRSGLICPEIISKALGNCALGDVRQLRMRDPDDPYQRDYSLWIGTVQEAVR